MYIYMCIFMHSNVFTHVWSNGKCQKLCQIESDEMSPRMSEWTSDRM